MASAEEVMAARSPMAADLAAGVEALSARQTITFIAYARVVLPLDGFVFWVKADILSDSALLNAAAMNAAVLDQGASVLVPARKIDVLGSLHYATDQQQTEQATFASNRVIFTAEAAVQDFNAVGENLIFIATFDGIRFAFSSRASFYRQTKLYHYVGHAIYSWMESQIIDDPQQLNMRQLVVSNSLPAWLALNQFDPAWPVPVPLPKIPLFPSVLVNANLKPPFAAVHIGPDTTEAIGMAPVFDSATSSSQLTRETVTVTLYGANNQVAIDWRDAVQQYSYDTEAFGIMNSPVPRDDKQMQNELNAIAMRKRMVFEVNYYQQNIRDLARQLILQCVPVVIPTDDPLPLIQQAPITVQT